ncbi:MAG: hypothetical protein RMM53_04050 [Bacteroidia bacterium]|nr:hypothetical protein [Bacteroidia bacterium]MDW8333369.1 hypothetical protein [Bacteroidia bacterium]
MAAPSLAVLACFGPQYDPDLFFYTSGALNWEPGRPPLYTMFLSVCRRLWPSPYFPVLLQIGLWAVAARALLETAFDDGRIRRAAALFLAFEPVGMYYRMSLLSEGLFEPALLWQTTFLLRGRRFWAGVAGGTALMTRYAALFCLPLWIRSALCRRPDPAAQENRRTRRTICPNALWGPAIAAIIIVAGHARTSGGATGPGAFLSYHLRPEIPECPVPDTLPRDEIAFRHAECLAARFAQHPPHVAKVKADSVLLHRSLTAFTINPFVAYARHLKQNLKNIFTNNRLDYRNNEIGFEQQTYRELDELAFRLYGLERRVWKIWTYPSVWNVWMSVFWLGLTLVALISLRRGEKISSLLAWSVAPVVLMIISPVPYKTRFAAPWMGLAIVWAFDVVFAKADSPDANDGHILSRRLF